MAVQRRPPVARGWLLFTSLGLGLFIAALVFAGFWAQRRLVREIEQDRAPLVGHERLTAGTIDNQFGGLERELLRLVTLADLKDAVAAGDRSALQEQILPPLNRLRKGPLRVSRITFYTPDGTVYLRAHAPESYGENVATDRPLIAEAITARRIVKGLEAERGVPYLWVAAPVYNRGQFIGVLEMGSSLAPIVDVIRTVTGTEVAVLLGPQTPRAAEASDAALFGKLAALLRRQSVVANSVRLVVATEGKTFAVSLVPLRDFSAREVGVLAIASDATAVTRILRNSSLVTVSTSFVGFILAIALLGMLARRLDTFYWNLETHVDQLKALGQVSQAVSSSLDLRQVLNTVARHAADLSDSDACGIVEFDVARQALDIVASYNLSEGFLKETQRIQIDPRTPAIVHAARGGRPVEIPDLVAATEYPLRDLALKEGFRALLAVPMWDENITRGIVLFRRVPGRLDDQVVNLLIALAHQSKTAIDNARLFQEVRNQRIQLEDLSKNMQQLYRLSTAMQEPLSLKEQLARVLEAARQLVAIDRFYIWAVTPQGDRLTALAGAGFSEDEWKALGGAEIPLTEAGAIYEAYQERAALVFQEQNLLPPELRLRPPHSEVTPISSKSFLVIPMIARGRLVGFFTADNTDSRKPILPHTVELLQVFASHAGIAVDNARLFQEIEEKGRLLEIASQHKSQFLSRMSHELRTPLNAVLGFAQVLEMDILPARHREGVEQILKGGRHLLTLIDEVLDISKIEAGHLAISLEPVQIGAVLRDVLELVGPIAAQRNIRIHPSEGAACDRHVLADRQRINQVLLNLLSNAVKYNREGGEVRLSCEETAGARVRIRVSDTGPGIAPDKMPRLFTPFDRLGAEQTGIEGTGLGLALSKRLVDAMGGAIGVESALGQGSTFWVEFALTHDPVERAGLTEAPLSTNADLRASQGEKVVLYIEDNLSNLSLVQHILANRPEIRLIPAMQGRLGLELAVRHHPAVILLDLHLPDMPGDEVLRRLQKDPETRYIPVLMITADAMPAQIQRLLAAGARDYLTKPLDVQKFLAVLTDALQDGSPGVDRDRHQPG